MKVILLLIWEALRMACTPSKPPSKHQRHWAFFDID